MNNAILMASGADIDIMVHGLISYEVFGQTCWITTTHVCMLILMIVLIGFFIAANRKIKKASEVPDGFQNVVETIVEMLDNMVKGAAGQAIQNMNLALGLEEAAGLRMVPPAF